MVLKYLEIQGFKSFADKTRVTFNNGLTAVVGPNGSGKSNLSDALRWVMGEQSNKTLRGSNMEDVIFSGTKSRKPQGFAEVSLCIDNTDRTLGVDSDEVIISRRYSRSGDSDYRINHANVRLKDVNELLMDTGLGKDGYAMVGQGKIAEIVQSKSDERRIIFEEAAGISKFRSRKNEAQKKLNAAEDNLVRLRDIVQELEDRVGPLKAQSEKAKQFLVLAEERKTLEVSVWMRSLETANVQLKDHDDRILARQLEHTEMEETVTELETRIASVYEEMQTALVAIDTLRREKEETEQEIANLTATIAVLENDGQHNAQNRERIEKELKAFWQSNQEFETTLNARLADITSIQTELEALDAEILKLEDAQQALLQKGDGVDDSRSALSRELNELLIRQSNQELNAARLSATQQEERERFEQNTKQRVFQQDELAQTERDLQDAESFLKRLEEQKESLQNMLRGYHMKQQSVQESVRSAKAEQETLQLQVKEKLQRARVLQDMENSMEGFAHSVKQVLSRGKNGALRGILGTVSQLIAVPEEYSTAIEIALGGTLQNIVVENEQNAKTAIRFLKQENAGRATFLPLTSVRGNRLSTNQFADSEGYVALACDLVQFAPEHRAVVDSLLGRIVIAEDLDAAVVIAKNNGYKFRIVTLDGQVVNAGGSMSGGSKNRSQGFFSRKTEIAALRAEAEKQQAQAEKSAAGLQEVEQEYAKIAAKIQAIQSELQVISEDTIRCESEMKRLQMAGKQQQTLLTAMEEELENFERRLNDLQQQEQTAREEMQEAEAKANSSREELARMEGERSEQEQQIQQMTQTLSAARFKRLERQKDIESEHRMIEELKQRNQDLLQQEHLLKEQIAALEEQSAMIVSQVEGYRATVTNRKERIAVITTSVEERQKARTALEAETNHLRDRERDLSVQKERLAQEIARFEEKKIAVQKQYDDIIRKLWEEYELTKAEAEHFSEPLDDVNAANKRLNSLRAQIRALGSVNVAAIEEYAEVSERYEFLSKQVRDVEHSRQELLRMIGDLTAQMRTIFEENFTQINRHFQRIFVELFGGGRAELLLTDPEDPLGCGIEIKVEPPGKIIKNLTSLSGGEQAFVAIAIYFAILYVRPAPFCVLDEIEAALDDVNVSKYAAYLRQMSGKTQFILITHRRGTMEEADTLYGVTMQDEGISKLLQLQVSEIEHQLGDLG